MKKGGFPLKKKTLLTVLSIVFLLTAGLIGSAAAAPYTDFDFDDITYWVGEGENQAGFVVDWRDDKEPVSLAWGYRWDGEATGADMIAALFGSGVADGGPYVGNLDGDDPRLYVRLVWWEGYNGYTVSGIGYDLDNDGFGYVEGENPGEDGEPEDPDDHYVDGWYTGYWSYWVSDDDSDWSYSGWGISARELSDGSWDGWSFSGTAGYGDGSAPITPVAAQAAVPLPGALWLLGSGLLGLAGIHRRRR
ncbi:hypothetical protein DSCO28_71040 [Desulfosarcina ovata subsp. sediminis]|uniref:Ice-binding protein C-terminal domain-containing protein n=1 Tax=Desulfosarcina ovata subsp. sediminis TaxID=885957 RepID=A0A5K8A2C3_9BACT|nr:hypothetical protein [Desulfosarcina ovata]BBO86538.1 hypothetical protein DSCO28_71040 [Desulfosarcina ovata subsp. sediminis]